MTVATGKGMQLAYNQDSKCGIQMYGLLAGMASPCRKYDECAPSENVVVQSDCGVLTTLLVGNPHYFQPLYNYTAYFFHA